MIPNCNGFLASKGNYLSQTKEFHWEHLYNVYIFDMYLCNLTSSSNARTRQSKEERLRLNSFLNA